MSIDPNELLYAYTQGFFPMAIPEENQAIYWFKPELRGILPLESFHIPGNLRRFYATNPFEMKINGNFEATIRLCAERQTTWISEEIVQSYLKLNELGFAMSFEAWDSGELVGGLYGVAIKRAFFGESMFFRKTNASKCSLIFLVEYLRRKNFLLLDTQYINDHLLQFGAREIPAVTYELLLKEALQ